MKPFSIIRKIDKLGRIVIPKDMRDFYGIELETPLEIIATKEGILISISTNGTDTSE